MRGLIYKYVLDNVDHGSEHEIEMPSGATVLCVQLQGVDVCLWVSVGEANRQQPETRTFVVAGTGNAFDATRLRYVGTVQQGPFVWHVYERTKE